MKKLLLIIPLTIWALNATEVNSNDIKTVKKALSLETKLYNCLTKLSNLEYTSDKGTNRKYRQTIKRAEAKRRECLRIDSIIRDNIWKLRKTPFKIPVSIGG